MIRRSWRPLQNKTSSPPPPPRNLHHHLHPSILLIPGWGQPHGAGTDPCSPSRFSSVPFSVGATRRRVSGAVRGIPRKGLPGPANIELLPAWGEPWAAHDRWVGRSWGRRLGDRQWRVASQRFGVVAASPLERAREEESWACGFLSLAFFYNAGQVDLFRWRDGTTYRQASIPSSQLI
jgi:hypothetical protein